MRVPAADRKALERLCRYLLRPPIADKRMRFRDDGKVELELKSPWPDGTTHLVFTPLELVEKAAALIPRPHVNLLVYHGVLAANAKSRRAIIAYERPFAEATPSRAHSNADADADDGALKPKPRSRSARDWATMMRRGLDLDVLSCPDCGARLRVRALLDDARIARPFAEKMGLLRPRAGPADLPAVRDDDTAYEPDPDFVDPDYDA